MNKAGRMSCAACGHFQLGAFPSIAVEGNPDERYERHALEVESIPLPKYGDDVYSVNKQTIFYACPNCGTLRIRIKTLN